MDTANRHERRRVETHQRRGLTEEEIEAAPDKLAAATGSIPASLPVGKAFQDYSGLARTGQYKLIARQLRSFRIGNRRFIEVASWHEFMAKRLALDSALRNSGERAKQRGCTSRWDDRPYVTS